MAIDFETFFKVVPSVIEAKFPVIIRGRHGIGKSEIVYQVAREIGLDVVERRASQMTEGDLVGLPVIKGESTSWNPPDWFKLACDTPVALFLDEVDRAVIEVRQGIFELTDSRKLNGHSLHPDTVVFAAVNGGEAEFVAQRTYQRNKSILSYVILISTAGVLLYVWYPTTNIKAMIRSD